MNTKKALTAVAAGLGAASLALAAMLPAAQADPTGAPEYRDLAGVGSDTTQDVMNVIANAVTKNGTKILGSYDALPPDGSTTISTKAAADCQNIPRPNGSSAGRDALVASLQAGDGCLQFARSSSSRGTKTNAVPLAYIPFALDGVAFAVNSDGDVPKEMTKAELEAIYKCQNTSVVPVLPQSGSGTRSYWLGRFGITETQITDGTYPCLLPKADGGTGVPYTQEHNGLSLKKNEVQPYSIAVWQAQATAQRVDVRGKTVLGVLDGVAPTVINNSYGYTRKVYNLIPVSKADDATSLEHEAFVGPNSLVCQQSAGINIQGFGVIADCGNDTDRG